VPRGGQRGEGRGQGFVKGGEVAEVFGGLAEEGGEGAGEAEAVALGEGFYADGDVVGHNNGTLMGLIIMIFADFFFLILFVFYQR